MDERAYTWIAGFTLIFGSLGGLLLFYYLYKQMYKLGGEAIEFPKK